MRFTLPELHIPEEGFSTENDIFLYREFGERLANLVSNISDPLVVTLDGSWGSGKSVFIKQWAGLMRERGGSVVYFDAFGNDIHDNAFLALASEIHFLAEDTLGKKNKSTQTFLDKATKVAKTLAPTGFRLAAHIGTGGLLHSEYFKAMDDTIKAGLKTFGNELEDALEKTIREKLQKTGEERLLLESFRKALEDVSKAITKKKSNHQPPPLIFIVDELDRCRPPFALDVIERIKHLFSVSNVCFVLVMDLPQLETAIQGAYGGKFDARTYLEKFYHLKVMLPKRDRINREQRERYLFHLWESSNLKFEFEDIDIAGLILGEIRDLAHIHELSLRQIERVMTNVVLVAATIKKNQWFIPTVIAGLCIMRQTHPNLYELAQENELSWEEVKDFLNVDDDGDDSDSDAMIRAGIRPDLGWKDWQIDWWRYCVDDEAPQRIIDNCSGWFMQKKMFGYSPLSLHTLASLIDNLPNPPAHGTDAGIPVSPFDPVNHAKPLKVPPAVANASQAFVKFFGVGTAKGRIDLSDRVIDIVRIQECHRVLAYPTGTHPRQVQDGDVVFISRMTKNPNDHRIFGWAIATKHRDGQDEATDEDIARCPWRKEYGSYIRVDEEGFEAEFLDGTMEAGVSLYELMKALGSDSFASTQRNASAGKGNTDPRKSIVRKPHIQLSEKGFAWLTDKLQEAFAKHGKISVKDNEKSD